MTPGFNLATIDPGGSDDPHRWFLFQPPFFGFNFAFSHYRNNGNFRADRRHFPPAGLVGNEVTLDDDDAGDDDYASGTADTEIAFAFHAPTAGLIEVLIDAQSTVSTNSVFANDEWGWSSSFTRQRNFLSLRVLHPNVPEPSLAQMADFSVSLDIDVGVVQESLNAVVH